MRYLFCVGVALFSFTTLGAEVRQPLKKAFVPSGYDNDDSVQIVVSGVFPDSCHKLGRFASDVSTDTMEIRLDLSANAYEGPKCLKMPVPFFQTIFLGRLRTTGTYTIVDRVSRNPIGKIKIDAAQGGGAGTDEETYAPLFDATLDREAKTVRLEGILPASCLELDTVEAENQTDVVVILPTIRKKEGVKCVSGEFPFSEKKDLKIDLPKETFLLHVRALGGQAIHKMVAPLAR